MLESMYKGDQRNFCWPSLTPLVLETCMFCMLLFLCQIRPRTHEKHGTGSPNLPFESDLVYIRQGFEEP